jgi:hypothetical protein
MSRCSRALVLAAVAALFVPAARRATADDGAARGADDHDGVRGHAAERRAARRIRRGEVGGVILFGGNISKRRRSAVARLAAPGRGGGGRQPAAPRRGRPGGRPCAPPAGRATGGARPRRMRNAAQAEAEGAATGSFSCIARDRRRPRACPRHARRRPATSSARAPSAATRSGTRASARPSSAACQRHGVAATAKHFPGLGTARGEHRPRRRLDHDAEAGARRAPRAVRGRRARGRRPRDGEQRRLPRLRRERPAGRALTADRAPASCAADSASTGW